MGNGFAQHVLSTTRYYEHELEDRLDFYKGYGIDNELLEWDRLLWDVSTGGTHVIIDLKENFMMRACKVRKQCLLAVKLNKCVSF